jgi:hypothetical protein
MPTFRLALPLLKMRRGERSGKDREGLCQDARRVFPPTFVEFCCLKKAIELECAAVPEEVCRNSV